MSLLGYKIFSTIDDFYEWQGYNGNPAVGTVNHELGYSTDNPINSIRYTYPHPHPGAESVTYDSLNMPVTITGGDVRVIAVITDECPVNLIPTGLITESEARTQGWVTDLFDG